MPRVFITNRSLTPGDHIFPAGSNRQQQIAIDERYNKIGYLLGDLRRFIHLH
jgi:hypothetical protein